MAQTFPDQVSTLLDAHSFVAIERILHPESSDDVALLTGWGEIDDRKTFVYCLDHSVLGRPGADCAADKVCEAIDLALRSGAPLIGLHGSSRARPEETVAALAGYGRILDAHVRCSGVIPQVSLVMDKWLGPSGFGAVLCDINVMVERSSLMYLNSPAVIRTITGEEISDSDLGGAVTHSTKSGIADLVVAKEVDALRLARYVMSFLPGNNLQSPPYYPPSDLPDRTCGGLARLIPASAQTPYNVVDLLSEIVDDGEILELQEKWGANLVVGFARLDGHVLGIVANQPSVLAGTLDINSSIKGARFVRLCDTFNIPLLVFLDTPGFRPGVQEEFGGIIRHGAKLVYAFAEATVPRVSLIARKAFGGAYIVMNSRHIRADLSFAWPSAEIAVMGAEGATKIIHRREIAAASDPVAREQALIEDYRRAFSNPYRAAERGYVDAVIDPVDTRRELIAAFNMLQGKRETLPAKKHGNIPL